MNEKIVREMRLNWRYLQSQLKNAHVEIGELREQNVYSILILDIIKK